MNDNATYNDVLEASRRIDGIAHRTPVMTSRSVNERTGAKVFFKCENLQRIGAFKFRGAYNALSQLNKEQCRAGVLTFSSGNHGQAIALSAKLLGIPATIIMPSDAPGVKIDATRSYGPEVILYDRATTAREELADRLVRERGMTLIPPYDHRDVIAGQGTAAKELIEETGPLDAFFVCVGGGGLISGCAIAANHLSPECRVIGVEPQAGDDATRSFHTGTLQTVHNPDTVADGARTSSLGKLTFPLVRKHVHDMMTVDDGELLRAMFYLWERMKIVVEPTGALAAAGLFKRAADFAGKRVGVLISGGNVDLADLPRLRRIAFPPQ